MWFKVGAFIMECPCRIGTEKIPKDIMTRFESEAHEYLLAVGGGNTSASKAKGQKYWGASAPILGNVDLTSGKKSSQRSSAQWALTDSEYESREYFNYLKQGGIYRVKGLPPKLMEGDSFFNNPFRMGGVYVLEILEKGVQDEFLQGLIDEFNKPVVISSKLFGNMTLERSYGWFEGRGNWLGETIDVDISCEDENDAKKLLPKLEEMFENAERWDKDIRTFAANELTELANDWLDAENEDEDGEQLPEITEEDFARRIKIVSIELDEDAEFTVFFDDDNMFLRHSVVVYGDLENGPNEANMEG